MIDVERGVFVRPVFVEVTGSPGAAILLSQIVYWCDPDKKGHSKLRVFRDGKLWLAKRRTDWKEECGLSPRQYDSAMACLVEKGFVETKRWRFAGSPTTHIWLDRVALNSRIGEFQFTQLENPIPQLVKSLTEITSKDYGKDLKRAARPQKRGGKIGVETGGKKSEGVIALCTQAPRPHVCNQLQTVVRGIDDWVADRPSLAEQKLRTMFTGEEWMAKANEILKRFRESKLSDREVRLTANSLAMMWKRIASNNSDSFIKEFTHKEMGQFKMFLDKVGVASPQVMRCVLEDWGRFTYEAKDAKGLKVSPNVPVIGFLLQYHDVAVNLMERKMKKDLKESQVDVNEPIDIPQENKESTQKEDIATIADVQDALASLGVLSKG